MTAAGRRGTPLRAERHHDDEQHTEHEEPSPPAPAGAAVGFPTAPVPVGASWSRALLAAPGGSWLRRWSASAAGVPWPKSSVAGSSETREVDEPVADLHRGERGDARLQEGVSVPDRIR